MRILLLTLLTMFVGLNQLKAQQQQPTLEAIGEIVADTLQVDTILSHNSTKVITVLDTLYLKALGIAQSTDSIVTVDPVTGKLRRRSATTIASSNIYSADGTLSENRAVSMNNNSLNFTGGKVGIDTLLLPKLQSGFATDSIVVADAVTGQLRRKSPETVAITNIYSNDGTLTGNRTVAMGTNTLNFTGNVGINNAAPTAPLQFANMVANRKVVLASTSNDDHQFYGFGVNNGVLRYQVIAINDGHVFYSGIDANSSRELMRIQGNGDVLIPNLMGSVTSNAGATTDSIVTVDPTTGRLRRRSVATISGINIYSNNGTLSENRTVSMNNNSLNFTGGKVGIDTLLLPKLQSGFATDSIVVADAVTGQLRRKSPETVAITNIYSNDGTLTGNRTVAMGTNTLNFTGNVGINNSAPAAPLQFANVVANRKIVLSSMFNDDHQFYGFGVNNGVLRYQVTVTGDNHVFYSGIDANSSRELMRIQGNGDVLIPNLMGSVTSSVGATTDSIVTVDPVTGRLRRRNVATISGINIYSNNGTLSENRTVSMNNNSLNFTGGKVGIDTLLLPKLQSGFATDSIVVVDAVTGQLRRRNVATISGINIYSNNGTLSENRTVSMNNNSLNFTGGKVGIDTLLLPKLQSGFATDSIVVVDAITGQLRRKSPSTVAITNIYSNNGTLSENRTVTMGTNSLNFTGGKVGIDTLLLSKLQSGFATDSIVVADAITGQLRRKSPSTVAITNIYSNDGVLTGNRTVTMGTNSLNFTGGKVGIDTLLLPKLQSGFATDSIVVADAVTGQLRRKSPSTVAITNIYSNDGVLTGNRTVTMGTNSLNFTGGKVGIDTLLLPKLQSGFATDSIVVVDAVTGQLRRRNVATISGINIYSNNGTLSENRTVSMNNNSLNFTGGKVGIDTLLLPKLQSGFATDSIVVVDAVTGQLRRRSVATISGINIYSNNGTLSENRTVSMNNNSLNFTGGKVGIDTLLLPKLQSGFATDSIVVVDAVTGQLRRRNVATISGINIYSNNGTLSENRTVSMNTNSLNFTGGKVGIDTLLLPKLQSGFATDSIVVVDAVTGQLRRRNVATITSSNIYNADGTLTSNRTVSMNNNSLNFTGGKVGIGTNNPTTTFEVVGPSKFSVSSNSSDMRWKKDILSLNNSLSIIAKLRPVSYVWRVDEFKELNFDSYKHYGFIAQEVEKILPELVWTDNKGFKSLEYNSFISILASAIQEQQDIIKKQSADIEELKKQLGEILKLLQK